MFGKTEKKVLVSLGCILFAAIMVYTVLLRSGFYNQNGLPKNEGVLRVVGENLAGNYALLTLLENGSVQDAYSAQHQTDFLSDKLKTTGHFASVSAPTLSFIIVPWLILGYEDFFSTWLLWGVFLFGISLYALFPLKKSILLLFAMPAVLLSFSFGGWGLIIASLFILTLHYASKYPKICGILAGLSIAEPFSFLLLTSVLWARGQRKAGLISTVFGVFICIMTGLRYGFDVFSESWKAGAEALISMPCAFTSVVSVFLCNGAPFSAALTIHMIAAISVLYAGFQLFRSHLCPMNIQNAYICLAALFVFPLTSLGDFALMYAATAFLLADSETRGFLSWDKFWLGLAFVSPFIDAFFASAAGVSVNLIILAGLLNLCRRRSF